MSHQREAEIELIAPFHDVDMVGIVWHGNFLKYFEHARTALTGKYDYDVDQMEASGYAWPVIEAKCKYIKPILYNMRIKVRATLAEVDYRLKINYLITNAETGERIARGYTMQVAIEIESREMCMASPPVLMEKFGVASDADC